MIRQGVCKYCSEGLRVNGDDKFKDLANSHFKLKHPKEHQHLHKILDYAETELREIKEKYPELYGYSHFQINWDRLLSKTEHKI